jgi:hypothetical protein
MSELDCTDTSPDNFSLSLGFNLETTLEIDTSGISGSCVVTITDEELDLVESDTVKVN